MCVCVCVCVCVSAFPAGTVTLAAQESLQSAMLLFSAACQCLTDNTAAWRRLEACRRLHDHSRKNPHMLKVREHHCTQYN